MPKNRILPALGIAALIPLVAWAQPPSAPAPPGTPLPAPVVAPDPPTEAEVEATKELDTAIAKVAALKSVSADVAQSVDMLDQNFVIKGRYLRAPNHRIYLRLDVLGLIDADGTMLQVCDGEVLWDYRKILDSQYYAKIGVAQVFEKLASPDLDAAIRAQVVTSLGFSGPEQLLIGLKKAVKFDQKEAATVDGREVWILRGEWRSREGMLGPNQQPLPATAPLPAYVPSFVVLTIGKDDGWPYKVRLVGRRPSVVMDTRKVGPDGRLVGSRSSIQEVKPTEVELTYTNVKLNAELNVEEFAFQPPPGARVDDSTQAIVQMLDQAILQSAAKRKAEAAKADDPLLKQSIDIPKANLPAVPATPVTPKP
jgi:outer membrane lipoprotein-sorting protein